MTTPIDNSLLHAWLDDELPSEQRVLVEAWLREHPHAMARVRLWAADREAMRAQLNPVVAEDVPVQLSQAVWRHASRPWRWPMIAAALATLAALALGIVLGAVLPTRIQPSVSAQKSGPTSPSDKDWVQRAVIAHAIYTPEVRHAVEVKAQEAHLARWLTARLKVQIKLFDLREQGFELIGGRLLPDGSGPSAQLMYQEVVAADATNKTVRVTLYVRRSDENTATALHFEQQGEVGLFHWVEAESSEHAACAYALVGALPRDRLLAMAEAIVRQR